MTSGWWRARRRGAERTRCAPGLCRRCRLIRSGCCAKSALSMTVVGRGVDSEGVGIGAARWCTPYTRQRSGDAACRLLPDIVEPPRAVRRSRQAVGPGARRRPAGSVAEKRSPRGASRRPLRSFPRHAHLTVPTTADLPPLSTNAPCVKCGCAHATTKYEPARSTPVSPGVLAQTPEHLARTCTRCGYTWRERPLDTVPTPDAASGADLTDVARATGPRARPDA